MKIAVVGVGAWGKNHAKTLGVLKKEGLVDAVAVCDSSRERAEAVAAEFGCATASLEEVKSGDFDGAVIATPSSTHYALARELMDAGKDVLVEKPLAMTFEESSALVKQAKEQKRVLMVGHEFRFHPGILHLKKMLENKELGKVVMMQANRFDFRAPRQDMGVLLALAIHDVDLFSFLSGEKPSKITVKATEFFRKGIEDHCTLALEFPSGIKCFAQESWLQPAYGKTREFIAVGTEKTVRIDFLELSSVQVFNSRFYEENGVLNAETGSVSAVSFEKKEPLKEELKNFLQCIKTRAEPLASGAVGADAVRVIEKAFEAMRSGKTERI
ncbi:MAG: Gfo/Idh/MocA family oxidoreductase [Candidatus Norongarragalinales archaeon]